MTNAREYNEKVLSSKSQDTLALIAIHNTCPEYRKMAAQKLTSQHELLEVATKSKDDNVIIEVVKKITNQESLKTIIFHHNKKCSTAVVLTVIEKITNQSTLVDIFKQCTDSKVRKEVFSRLTEHSISLL